MTRLARLARFALGASCSLLCVATASPAFAQSAGSAEAEELFKQGRAALEAKDYATACTKLAESNRLERAVGTLISLAQCEEAQTKLASARQHWQEAADLADALQDRLNRGVAARQRFAELDKRVPRLTVKRAPGAPPSTSVKRDDVSLTSASFDSALPVDPGKHVLVVSAESHESKTFEVTLAEGENKQIEVEPGAAIALAPPPPVTPVPEAPNDGARAATPSSSGSMKLAAYTVGGVGIVGLGLGTFFGLRASSKWSSAKDECNAGPCNAGSEAQKDKDDASSAGTISTIAFVIGGAALATGVVLLVLSPSSPSSPAAAQGARMRVVAGPGTLAAVGEF